MANSSFSANGAFPDLGRGRSLGLEAPVSNGRIVTRPPCTGAQYGELDTWRASDSKLWVYFSYPRNGRLSGLNSLGAISSYVWNTCSATAFRFPNIFASETVRGIMSALPSIAAPELVMEFSARPPPTPLEGYKAEFYARNQLPARGKGRASEPR